MRRILIDEHQETTSYDSGVFQDRIRYGWGRSLYLGFCQGQVALNGQLGDTATCSYQPAPMHSLRTIRVFDGGKRRDEDNSHNNSLYACFAGRMNAVGFHLLERIRFA